MNAIEIPIGEIRVDANRRQLGDITELSMSIAEVGLLNPITVTSDHKLIAGLHRLRACEQLGWTEIPSVVLELLDLKAELAEIDENLVRNQLTDLDHSDQVARRKEIYEALHPGAKAGAHRAAGMNQALGNDVGEMISPTFVEDTAAKAHVSKRTVQQAVQIATKIPPAVKAMIRNSDMPINKTRLLKISRLEPEQQAQEVERLMQRTNARVEATTAATDSEPVSPEVLDLQFSTIVLDLESLTEMSTAKSRIKEVSKPDSTLWLWASNQRMPEAFDLVTRAGFVPRTILTWVTGSTNRCGGIHEGTQHCILSVRGKPEIEIANNGLALIAPNGADRKPEEFYELVERCCPTPRTELFASHQREGWGTEPVMVALPEQNEEPSQEEEEQHANQSEDQNEDPDQNLNEAQDIDQEQDQDQLHENRNEAQDPDPDREISMMESIARTKGRDLPKDPKARLELMREAQWDVKKVPSERKKYSKEQKQYLRDLQLQES